jgi:hypothetical protein
MHHVSHRKYKNPHDWIKKSLWWPRIAEVLNFEPLGPLELVDAAQWNSECAAFFGMWADYYRAIKSEVLETLAIGSLKLNCRTKRPWYGITRILFVTPIMAYP